MNEDFIIVHQSPASIEVISKVGTLTVSAPGPLGPRGFTGATGPQGPAGNNISRFADLEDVLLVNLSNDNIIKWNSALQAFVNQESVDGGSF